MKILRLALLAATGLALASCEEQKADPTMIAEAENKAAKEAAADGKIECALAAATDFFRVCETELITGPDGDILVIRHPDSGFRRFKIVPGRGVEPAEGFDPTTVTTVGTNMIEVNSGGDRYRLPAQVKAKLKEEPKPEAVETHKPG
jgi:hypothetical protein